MRARAWIHTGVIVASVAAGPLGCAEILGLLDRAIDDETGGTGAGTTTTTSTADVGGAGGAGACKPESTEKCSYSGPPGTEDVGACQVATRTCNDLGAAWGPCAGEVTPQPESCSTPIDDDCDGEANEADAGCSCVPGTELACYSGPPETQGQGICSGGIQACAPDGLSYGPCSGQVLPGVEDAKVALDEDCDGFSSSEATFASIWGDGGEQRGLAVAVDPVSGEIYLAGEFNGSMTFGADILLSNGVADTGDVFVAKLDASGDPIWALGFGDSGGDQGVNGLAVDGEGGVIITGYNRFGTLDFGGGPLPGGIFIAKLAADGGHEWSHSCGSDLGAGVAVATTQDGDAVIAGYFSDTMDCGTGEVTSTAFDDVFLLRLSGATGAVSWLNTFAGTGDDMVAGVAIDSADNIFLAGSWFGSLDLEGTFFTSPVYDFDGFVTKRASDGSHIWSRSIEGAGSQIVTDLATTPLGGAIVVGNYQNSISFSADLVLTSAGGADVMMIAYGAAGNLEWAEGFGASNDQSAGAVAVDSENRVSAAGFFKEAIDFGGGAHGATSPLDGFVVQLSGAGGAFVWDRAFGGSTHGVKLAVGPNGKLVAVGTANGTLDFGSQTLVTGGLDVFLAILDP